MENALVPLCFGSNGLRLSEKGKVSFIQTLHGSRGVNIRSRAIRERLRMEQVVWFRQLRGVWRSTCLPLRIMASPIRLDGLLFTHDTEVMGVMSQILENFSIKTETCSELGSAIDAVTQRRLDAIIVDWADAYDPTRIVRSARKSSPNGNSTIVALVNPGSETHALLVGANFMIHKPADIEHAGRCMRAAYGTMLQNRRRAARVPVDIAVNVRVSECGVIRARISDLSIGGIALQCEEPLEVNSEVLTNFVLPNTDQLVQITGKIVNANSAGRAGVRFSFVPEQDQEALEGWLALELSKLEKAEMPA